MPPWWDLLKGSFWQCWLQFVLRRRICLIDLESKQSIVTYLSLYEHWISCKWLTVTSALAYNRINYGRKRSYNTCPPDEIFVKAPFGSVDFKSFYNEEFA